MCVGGGGDSICPSMCGLWAGSVIAKGGRHRHSPCHCLEGIKDALCHKIGMLRIRHICGAVCTNKGAGAIETCPRLNGWHKAPRV